jgi:Ca2+-transporting ATPase
LIAFEDPVRPGVPAAVAQCRSAGIRVVMVTGDHPGTAAAIAAEIGLGSGRPEVVLAEEFERRVAAEDDRGRIDVVARALPSQKLALVRALQRSGEIVAVTGDGVTDVPALQAADIGIAMGERGTRSAREVADIVLLDDNFASLASAIAEGRQLFTNLQLSFQYLLTIHIPLVITAALVPLLGYPLLYLPIHIVWLELIIHPTALLVFQQLPPAGLRPRPSKPGHQAARFFERLDWIAILAAGLLITGVILATSLRSFGSSRSTGHARAMALVALVVASGTVTAALSRLRSWPARLIVAGTVLSAVLFVQEPRLASWLGLEPLHADDWAIAAGGGLLAASLSALRWLTVGRAPDPARDESGH